MAQTISSGWVNTNAVLLNEDLRVDLWYKTHNPLVVNKTTKLGRLIISLGVPGFFSPIKSVTDSMSNRDTSSYNNNICKKIEKGNGDGCILQGTCSPTCI